MVQKQKQPMVQKPTQVKMQLSTAQLQQAKAKLKKTPKKADPFSRIALLQAHLNPFDPSLSGLKLPDACAFPSVPFTLSTIRRITADANGRAVCALTPYGSVNFIEPTRTAGNFNTPYDWTTTPAASGLTNWSNYVSAFSLYRLVVGGFRLKCDGSINNMTGRIYVVDVPINTDTYQNGLNYFPSSTAEATVNGAIYTEYTMLELMQDGILGTLRRIDAQSEFYRAENYPATVSAAGSLANPVTSSGWCAKIIILEGLPANANCIELEQVYHIETAATSKDSIVSPGHAAAYSPSLMGAVYNVSQAQPVSVKTTDGWSDDLVKYIKNGVHVAQAVWEAGSALAPMLAPLLM